MKILSLFPLQTKTPGLQFRMTLSYVWVTIVLTLFLQTLLLLLFAFAITTFVIPFVYTLLSRQIAEHYSLEATLLSQQAALTPNMTFQPNQPATLALPGKITDDLRIPYLTSTAPTTFTTIYALLIAPDGHVLASSYPLRYPPHQALQNLLPAEAHLITLALSGRATSNMHTPSGVSATEPVWGKTTTPIGVVYVGITGLPSLWSLFITQPTAFRLLLLALLLGLVITTPIGALFGWMTTRHLIQRIRSLASATTRFAAGDYTQRVSPGSPDELGRLAQQFNWLGQQLSDSIYQQRELTERNTRLTERARISRDLHDSVKQQVFALAAQIGAARSLLFVDTTKVEHYLHEANELAYQVRQDLTNIIQEMRPTILMEQGFVQALRQYLAAWSRQNEIDLAVDLQEIPLLPTHVEEELLHITQEAFSNIARHSHATTARLMLKKDQEAGILLLLSDNGAGFEPAHISSESIGLQSIKERVQSISGQLLIESQSGKGTTITISYPYPDKNERN